jgi:hypothetical protein
MNFTALSTSSKILLGAGALLFIDLFLAWQKVCAGVSGFSVCGSRSGWSGWGILLGLCVIGLLAWEAIQLAGVEVKIGVAPALVSAGLAAAILLFTIIKFLADNQARHWPSWLGLLLAVVIAAGGWLRYSGGAPAPMRTTQPPPTPGM